MKIEISVTATTKQEVAKVEALIADLKRITRDHPDVTVEVKRQT